MPDQILHPPSCTNPALLKGEKLTNLPSPGLKIEAKNGTNVIDINWPSPKVERN
ncbi:MAG: hypothetical protein V4675_08435 [Verrucomicrobiota bacterium]